MQGCEEALAGTMLMAAFILAGCASLYDDQARRQCEEEARAQDRGACLDRVDQHRRERDG